MTDSNARGRPKVNSLGNKELDKAEEQLKAYEKNINELTLDRMRAVPLKEEEAQTKISQVDLEKTKDLYLKPKRRISSQEKFNEKFRDKYEFAKQYVHFIAENKEIIGESIKLWTKKFPGVCAEEWEVPVNKPVWGPRYLAEQIRAKVYSRLTIDDKMGDCDGFVQYYGQIVVDQKVPRLTAEPVISNKSVFMNSTAFKQ